MNAHIEEMQFMDFDRLADHVDALRREYDAAANYAGGPPPENEPWPYEHSGRWERRCEAAKRYEEARAAWKAELRLRK